MITVYGTLCLHVSSVFGYVEWHRYCDRWIRIVMWIGIGIVMIDGFALLSEVWIC